MRRGKLIAIEAIARAYSRTIARGALPSMIAAARRLVSIGATLAAASSDCASSVAVFIGDDVLHERRDIPLGCQSPARGAVEVGPDGELDALPAEREVVRRHRPLLQVHRVGVDAGGGREDAQQLAEREWRARHVAPHGADR